MLMDGWFTTGYFRLLNIRALQRVHEMIPELPLEPIFEKVLKNEIKPQPAFRGYRQKLFAFKADMPIEKTRVTDFPDFVEGDD
jgi:hypothetical protein